MNAIESAVERLELWRGPILVAVSGGIDSTVLLHALAACVSPHPLELIVGHVEHGLRGEASRADAEAVAAGAAALGLPHRETVIDVSSARAAPGSRARPTVQEAARRARYEALREMADEVGAIRIATAHNLDDQAETVLLRILRGAGPDALSGIPELQPEGSIVRPLLRVSRDEIHAWAIARGITWREDASNSDLRYARNRLRADWLPGLRESFNPQLTRSLVDLAEAHRRDAEWLQELVREAASSWLTRIDADHLELARKGWGDLPEALARRLVQRAFRELGAGRDLSRVHLMRVLDFLREGSTARGGARIELPGGLRLYRSRDRYLLTRIREIAASPC